MDLMFGRIAGSVFGIGIALALLTPAQAQVSDGAASIAARLDGLAAGFILTEQVPGAVAAVVTGDEVILLGWGYADLEAGIPAGPDDTRFEIGSSTKLFTWTAVMMLLEERRIDLHADVSGYLPGFTVPGTEPLTLAQLMSHRPDTRTTTRSSIRAPPRARRRWLPRPRTRCFRVAR